MEPIRAQVNESSRDVVAIVSDNSSAAASITWPHSGAGIANCLGVPGTLGCIAYTLDTGRPVLLSTWHVLFGNGAKEGGAVWLRIESAGNRHFAAIGKALYGKLGTVHFDGRDYHLDCAVSSYDKALTTLADGSRLPSAPSVTGYDSPRLGGLVTKRGNATGITRGTLVDIGYSGSACVEGNPFSTPGQILVRPLGENEVFSAEGDSGALIVDEANNAVGLLWGSNVRGEGLACPIAPVLYAMNITLAPPAHLSS
ncbi:MAG TPA: hypothetical protein VN937_06270 [Blastocatellia bacterium]|nr:hypothetical protein [Blastocatellia bacterium]